MVRIIFIRHALPVVDHSRSSTEWVLSPDGLEDVKTCRQYLRNLSISLVYTSSQAKAKETANLLFEGQQVSFLEDNRLDEVIRPGPPLKDVEEFKAAVKMSFLNLGHSYFGWETNLSALGRFTSSIEDISEQHPSGVIAVVTHGTVLTLYLGFRGGFLGNGQALGEVWEEMKFCDLKEVNL